MLCVYLNPLLYFYIIHIVFKVDVKVRIIYLNSYIKKRVMANKATTVQTVPPHNLAMTATSMNYCQKQHQKIDYNAT